VRHGGEADEGCRITAKKKKRKFGFFFPPLKLLRNGEKRDSEDGFENLEALSVSWLGGESVPFIVLGFLIGNKEKGRSCRILL
jgi:hypothetical protein